MKIIKFDSQILSSFSHCPLRCNYRFNERLQPKGESIFFAKGKVVHVAMETYYGLIIQKVSYEERVKQAILTANTYATTQTNLIQDEIDSCIDTCEKYFKYRLEERMVTKAVEAPFTKLLYEGQDLSGEPIKIYYEGKIDLVGDLAPYGDIVIDHKTTGKKKEPTDLMIQFLGYKWATGLDVMVNQIGFQKTLAPSEKFKRFKLKLQDETVEQWRKFAIRQGLRFARSLETNFFEPNFGSCAGTHDYPCDFINMCRFPSMQEETRKFEFIVGEPWDVFSEKNT